MVRSAIMAAALLLPVVATAATRVWVEGGNVSIERDGATKAVTQSGRDSEPVLSPDGTFVVFTRSGEKKHDDMDCKSGTDTLMRIDVDGTRESALVRSAASQKPEGQLCGFTSKQFSSDGGLLYFLTPGWATSSALHVYDFKTQTERFVVAANGLFVLSGCKGEHKDRVAIARHKYFVFGGSYDWYWLYDPKAKTEIGPLGDIDDKDIAKQAALWCGN